MSIKAMLASEDATALAARIRNREISAPELLESAISASEAANPQINAVSERLHDEARIAVRTSSPKAPFHGVPIAIKDLGISLKGIPVTSGSRVPPNIADGDSLLVDRYREAGFIPFVTTTTPEFGLRLVTESALHGVTRNPWNTDHTPGGSSGGAAAMVAAGAVPVAHASDGGGSIRVPAACCGLVGMKPSRGRVPLSPDAMETWHGLIVQHVITRSVRDSAAILDLTSQPDPLSPYLPNPEAGSFARAAATPQKRMKVGIYRASPLDLDVSQETMAALDATADAARSLGHETTELDLSMITRDFMADFAWIIAASIAGEMRHLEMRHSTGLSGRVERATRILRRFGEVISAGELYAAQQRLQRTSMGILAATGEFDAVLMPVLAHPPVRCGTMDPKGMDLVNEQVLDALRLTRLLKIRPLLDQLIDLSLWFTHWPAIQNVTGQPAIALPVHMTADGLPLGVQAVGRIGGEAALFSLAGQLEGVIGWRRLMSPMAKRLAE